MSEKKIGGKKKSISPKKNDPSSKSLKDSDLVGGMSSDAHQINNQLSNKMTHEQLGVSDKRILIPSFMTTSKLFGQHFQILRELKHRIDLLKQAYEDQRAVDRSWDQINKIIEILD